MNRCARCQVVLEDGDLRCPVCALATQAPAVARPVGASILRCDRCGAAIAYDAQRKVPRCAFCGSSMSVETPTDPPERASLAIDFRVTSEQAGQAMHTWLSGLGFFRPRDLASEAVLSTLTPLLFCAWVVDADAWVSFTADSDAGSGRSAWAPHAGQLGMSFRALLVPASRGLSAQECTQLGPAYDIQHLRPLTDAPAGVVMEQFDVQRSMARQRVADTLLATAAQRLQQERVIPGSRYRNVHVAALLRGLTTHRVVLPAYVLAYQYRGKVYRAIVHGTDARLAFGDAPLSWRKIIGIVLVVVLVIAIVVMIVNAVQ